MIKHRLKRILLSKIGMTSLIIIGSILVGTIGGYVYTNKDNRIENPDENFVTGVATSGTSILPPTGAYLIGTKVFELIDDTRKSSLYPAGRPVPIQLYFPTTKGNEKKTYNKITTHLSPTTPVNITVFANPESDISSLKKLPDRFPIVIINHAHHISLSDYAIFAEDLASHGFVVVSIQHQLKTDPPPVEKATLEETRKPSWESGVANILFVIDWIKSNKQQLFSDKIDPDNISLMGHSFGGDVITLLANTHPGIVKKFISLDNLRLHMQGSSTKILLIKAKPVGLNHRSIYFKGTNHAIFMDKGYFYSINKELDDPKNRIGFVGSESEARNFFKKLRKTILQFVEESSK